MVVCYSRCWSMGARPAVVWYADSVTAAAGDHGEEPCRLVRLASVDPSPSASARWRRQRPPPLPISSSPFRFAGRLCVTIDCSIADSGRPSLRS